VKCPKCGYLGFEQLDRCRHCGHPFSIGEADPVPELPMRSGSTPDIAPLEDLTLRRIETAKGLARERTEADSPNGAGRSGDLPLFGTSFREEQPLKSAPPPRPPLAVRRRSPELPRSRAENPRTPSLDLDSSSEAAPPVSTSQPRADGASGPVESSGTAAVVGARVVAAAIDLALLVLVDIAVVYLTLQICGASIAELSILPKGPLFAFLIVQNGGYLVAFTAGGQTLGKMAAGIRVVAADAASSVDVGHALLRTLVWLVLAAPAGLGFLTAVMSRDRRGLHDRFAGTRVVRA
jgi:uncharacterized RDD family membrane protein YckC